MTKKHSGDIFSILTALFVVAVITISGLFLFKFTNGFKEELKTFYVTIDGKDIISSAKGYTVSSKDGLTVKPIHVFGVPDNTVKEFSVKITTNYDKEHNFDYTVDGKTYSFGAGDDFTEGFYILYTGDGSFVLKPKGYLNDIMKAVYKHSEISDCSNKEFDDMFILTVYSYNGESSVSVFFTIEHTITGISLDKTEVNL